MNSEPLRILQYRIGLAQDPLVHCELEIIVIQENWKDRKTGKILLERRVSQATGKQTLLKIAYANIDGLNPRDDRMVARGKQPLRNPGLLKSGLSIKSCRDGLKK